MILPLFARRFESFGAGVEAVGMSALAYTLTSTFAALCRHEHHRGTLTSRNP